MPVKPSEQIQHTTDGGLFSDAIENVIMKMIKKNGMKPLAVSRNKRTDSRQVQAVQGGGNICGRVTC